MSKHEDMTSLRRSLLLAAFVGGLAIGGAAQAVTADAAQNTLTIKPTPPAEAASAAHGEAATRVERGRYLAVLGDCTSCHTAKGGKPFAGGRPIDTGFGVVYGPNLTPDKETGIGNWSKDDFYRAVHHGRDDEDKYLYPAFPYPWFTKVTRSDVDALKDYLASLPPVHQQNKPPEMHWWLSWRFELLGWNLLFFDPGEFKADPTKSAEWNRGAYLVTGLGHCGDCHSQKNYFGGVIGSETLAGGHTMGGHDKGWFAPSLRGEQRSGLGRWSIDDIVTYLKTGSNVRTAAAGPMTEAVIDSTSHFSDADLKSVAIYLKSLPPRHEEKEESGFTEAALDRQAVERGQGLFIDNCAACHMLDGNGLRNFFPALRASSAVQARDPATVIRIVLQGANVPAAAGQRSYIAMPAFGRKLDDRDVADVVNYIRNAWLNRGSTVDAGKVASERKALANAKD